MLNINTISLNPLFSQNHLENFPCFLFVAVIKANVMISFQTTKKISLLLSARHRHKKIDSAITCAQQNSTKFWFCYWEENLYYNYCEYGLINLGSRVLNMKEELQGEEMPKVLFLTKQSTQSNCNEKDCCPYIGLSVRVIQNATRSQPFAHVQPQPIRVHVWSHV